MSFIVMSSKNLNNDDYIKKIAYCDDYKILDKYINSTETLNKLFTCAIDYGSIMCIKTLIKQKKIHITMRHLMSAFISGKKEILQLLLLNTGILNDTFLINFNMIPELKDETNMILNKFIIDLIQTYESVKENVFNQKLYNYITHEYFTYIINDFFTEKTLILLAEFLLSFGVKYKKNKIIIIAFQIKHSISYIFDKYFYVLEKIHTKNIEENIYNIYLSLNNEEKELFEMKLVKNLLNKMDYNAYNKLFKDGLSTNKKVFINQNSLLEEEFNENNKNIIEIDNYGFYINELLESINSDINALGHQVLPRLPRNPYTNKPLNYIDLIMTITHSIKLNIKIPKTLNDFMRHPKLLKILEINNLDENEHRILLREELRNCNFIYENNTWIYSQNILNNYYYDELNLIICYISLYLTYIIK
jgi:hypothetical protein